MLRVTHLTKAFGSQTVLDNVSFVLNRGERAALVGPNGAGKTTLLRIIAGSEQPDAGSVRLDAHATLGYLPQGFITAGEETHATVTLDGLVRQAVQEWSDARAAMDMLAERLAMEPTHAVLLNQYSDAATKFEELGGYEVEARIADVLRGLGLDKVRADLPLERLSGGQRTRAGLARLLISDPNLLLLDEPTNHLDVSALEWLEKFLSEYSGAVLMVSHDRVFLDRSANQILELDDATHQLTSYHGNYSEYEAEKKRELEQQWAAWQDQQVELLRLTESAKHLRGIAKFRPGGKADTNDKFAKAFFANRSKATVGRAKNIEKRIERLQSEEKVDKPTAGYAMKLDFGDETARTGQIVLTLEDIGIRFGEKWLLRDCSAVLRHGERIALVGANGTGKSTLLRVIVGEMEPTVGRVQLGSNVRIGYMPQEQETLDPQQTPLGLVRSLLPIDETDARHMLHFFMFQRDEVFTPIGKLSYGERARLVLAKLVAERANVLVLDEPINHLDISSRERFEQALETFPGTILVAVHDRAFIDRFARGIWAIEHETLRAYPDRASMRGQK